ncbi:MAG: hypothetical protein WCI47_00750 [bacterium]
MRLADVNRKVLILSLTIFLALLSASLLVFLIFATAPRDIGPTGVTIWFIALFIFLSSFGTLLRYSIRVRSLESEKQLSTLQRQLRSSVAFSLFMTVALAMQSLRMLNIGDLMLFLLILGIIELYFRTK